MKQIIVFLILSFNLIILSDLIYLSNGNILKGQITGEDKYTYTIRNATGILTLSKLKVAKVERESMDKSYEEIGDGYFSMGKYEEAIKFYSNAYKINNLNFSAKRKLEKAIELQKSKQEKEKKKLEEEIRKKLSEYKAFNSNEEFEKLLKYINKIYKDPEIPDKLKQKVKKEEIKIHYAYALFLIDHFNNPLAIEELKKVLKLNPNFIEAKEKLANLYELDPATVFKAIKLYSELYEKTKKLKYLKKVVYLSNDYKVLLDRFRYVKKYYKLAPDDKKSREIYIKALKLIAEDFENRGNYKAAKKTYDELEKLGEKVPIKKKLGLKFKMLIDEAKNADSNEIEKILKPSIFARENNLIDKGFNYIKNVYFIQKNDPDIKEEYYKYADIFYNEAIDNFNKGNYDKTVKLCLKIASNFPKYKNIDAVISLRKKAEIEAEREKLKKKTEALNLVRHARQYYNRALGYIQQLKDTEMKFTELDNPFTEAERLLLRARSYCYKALQLDPSLARPSSEDLNTLISDINYKLQELQFRRTYSPQFYKIQNRVY